MTKHLVNLVDILMLNIDRLFGGRSGRWVILPLILVTHGINLGLWAYLMKSGLIDPEWIAWRFYMVSVLAGAVVCLTYADSDAAFRVILAFVCPAVWLIATCVVGISVLLLWSVIIPWWSGMFMVMMSACWGITCLFTLLAIMAE